MSTDWREKEREFLSSLEADTGRDLGQWMTFITEQRLGHRNDIIDWLRRQGFLFARASWLERIYNNGGKPIYITMEDLAGVTAAQAVARPATLPARNAAPPLSAPPAKLPEPEPIAIESRADLPVAMASDPMRLVIAAAAADEIAEVLAKAKAFRPLAAHLLKAVEVAVPGLVIAAGPSHLMFGAPRAFALLAVSGKDLRLAIDLGDRPVEPPLEPAKLPVTVARPAAGMRHMIVLTDARQIDPRLVATFKAAAALA